MIGPIAQCQTCKHWLPPLDNLTERKAAGTADIQLCDAFTAPPGIPSVIWSNQFDHRESFQGDHGVHWDALDPETEYPADLLEFATAMTAGGYTEAGPETVGEERTFHLP